ncbi:hypothetical protein HN937_08130, partial [Candidatus Poribacteria bacterium]|nr:hypothetical protein [Candidatus Poribacteria bacterium]
MLSLSCATAVAVIASASDRVLFAFTDEAELPQVAAQDVEMSTLPGGGLRFETGARGRWPGVRLTPAAAWDLSEHARIEVDVRNSGEDSVVVFCRVDNPGGDGATNSLTTRATVPPGAVITLNTPLRGVLPGALAEGLYGMRGFPGGFSKSEGIDPSVVTQLIIFTTRDDAGLESAHVVDIMSVTAAGAAAQPEWLDMPVDDFYPFIDRYGQFAHAEWPGKVHSDEDLVSRRQAEDTELAAKPGPDERDEYGGWAAGPQLDATGFFRVEKVEGKWWLVDPNGRLFWSHGVDCVRPTTGTTPITDREHY